MEIVVIDDHSPNNLSEQIVASLWLGRVRYYRNETTLGLAGNWNQCIRLSRGHWVHILHQDDLILPGFYDRLRCADLVLARSGAPGFCQHVSMDADGRWFLLERLNAPARVC